MLQWVEKLLSLYLFLLKTCDNKRLPGLVLVLLLLYDHCVPHLYYWRSGIDRFPGCLPALQVVSPDVLVTEM